MELLRRAFYPHVKNGAIRITFAGREFFPQCIDRPRKVVGQDRRGAQTPDSITALGNRFLRPTKGGDRKEVTKGGDRQKEVTDKKTKEVTDKGGDRQTKEVTDRTITYEP
jgi:hypothetical protein